jgi:hypothetical protein
MALLGLCSCLPTCLLNVVQLLWSFFACLLIAVITCLLVDAAESYKFQLQLRRNRNTTSSEVPVVVTVEERKDSPPSYSECFENDAPLLRIRNYFHTRRRRTDDSNKTIHIWIICRLCCPFLLSVRSQISASACHKHREIYSWQRGAPRGLTLMNLCFLYLK